MHQTVPRKDHVDLRNPAPRDVEHAEIAARPPELPLILFDDFRDDVGAEIDIHPELHLGHPVEVPARHVEEAADAEPRDQLRKFPAEGRGLYEIGSAART